jgi:hypothetical protein
VELNLKKWITLWQPDKNIEIDQVLIKDSIWLEQISKAFTPSIFINGNNLWEICNFN